MRTHVIVGSRYAAFRALDNSSSVGSLVSLAYVPAASAVVPSSLNDLAERLAS
jgi:hypothetical protein